MAFLVMVLLGVIFVSWEVFMIVERGDFEVDLR